MKLVKQCIMLLLMNFSLFAAEIVMEDVPDSSFVNEPFELIVQIEMDSSQKVIPEENSGWYRSVQIADISTQKMSSTTSEVIFTMKGFAPQLCSIPSFELYIVPVDSTDTTSADTLVTSASAIPIISSLTVPVDSLVSASFNHPMKAGEFPWQALAIIIVSTILIVIVLVVLIRWIAMKIQNRDIFGKPLEPEIPPYEEAIVALHTMDSMSLETSEELKEGTFVLSEILKRYIGRRFRCHVQEATSTEFRAWIRGSELSREQNNMLEKFIAETDPVKFANIAPTSSTLMSLLSDVKQFIDETKPEIEEGK